MSKESESRLSNKDRRFLNLARNLASSSSQRMKHGAVVVKSNRVLSTGVNKFRNHPTIIPEEMIKESCSTHAEIDALKKIRYDAKNATIYVARVNNQGRDMISRPCNNCYVAIKQSGIKDIVYTD